MNKYFYIAAICLVSACNGTPTKPIQTSAPMFVEAESSFKWYTAHRRGEVFELLEDASGDKFVMTYDQRNAALLLPLMVVPANYQFGMMLNDELCSTGLTVLRGANSKTYLVNLRAGWDQNIRETPPTGICFRRVAS